MADYYALLGLGPAASAREIRAAFRQLAKRLHPDVSPLPGAAERFRRIVEAYETLIDPALRAAYDAAYRPAGPSAWSATGAAGGAPVGGRVDTRAAPPAEATYREAERGATGRPGREPAPTQRKPARPRGPATPVAPVAPVGAVGSLSPGERARRAAEAARAAAVRVRCVECGALVSGDADRCPACLRKYGTFQEHLARAVARARRA